MEQMLKEIENTEKSKVITHGAVKPVQESAPDRQQLKGDDVEKGAVDAE